MAGRSMRKEPITEKLYIRLTRAQRDKLENMATETSCTLSDVVRSLIDQARISEVTIKRAQVHGAR